MDQSTVTVTIYAFDDRRVFSGAIDVDPMGAVPPGLLEAPPAMEDGEVAQAQNGAWVVLPEYPATEPPPVPPVVPMLNARLALIAGGHMGAVNAHLAGMVGVDGDQARAYFEFAQSVRRDHSLVDGLRVALGLTPAQIDAMFIAAAALG